MKGYVIAPDGFEGTLADSYADDAALAAAGNLVFLPAAGNRFGSVSDVGDAGNYWSSSAYDEDIVNGMHFDSSTVSPVTYESRFLGYSVRLVTDVK